MNYDLSGLWDENKASWPDEPLSALRDRPGHWVVMFSDRGQVYRHHLVVGKSKIPGAGLGLFTVTGLDPAVQPSNCSLSKCIVGMYTGVPAELSAPESARISAVTLTAGT